jgi:hypothetical protein
MVTGKDIDQGKFSSTITSGLGIFLTQILTLGAVLVMFSNVISWKKDMEYAIKAGWTIDQQLAFTDALRAQNPSLNVPPISIIIVNKKGE